MTAARASSGRIRQLIPFVVIWPFLLSRLWVALWVYIAHRDRPFLAPVDGGWAGVGNWWLNPWGTYDSAHFISIATHGYEPHTTPFFPLYPLLLKLAGSNIDSIVLWGVIVSNIALLFALALLYRLTTIDHDSKIALLTVSALAFFPTSMYFSAVYSESLFLLLLTATFLCVRQNRWGWAALWALLAALTRNSGFLICIALAIEYFQQSRRNDDATATYATKGQALLAIGAPLMGFVAVQGYFALRFGSLLAGVSSQQLYKRTVTWPWTPLWSDLTDALGGRNFNLSDYLHVIFSLAVFVLLILCWKRIPLSYSILVLGIAMMNLTFSWMTKPNTAGMIRYMMTTFPFSQMLALQTENVAKSRMLKVALAIAYLAMCAVMSWLFGMKSFTG